MLCVFPHNKKKGKKTVGQRVTPPLKETGSWGQLQSLLQAGACSSALLLVIVEAFSDASRGPLSIGQTPSRNNHLTPLVGRSTQLTVGGQRAGPPGDLVASSSHCFSLGSCWLDRPDSSLGSDLHVQHSLETALSLGNFDFRWFFYWGRRWDKCSDALKIQAPELQRFCCTMTFSYRASPWKDPNGEHSSDMRCKFSPPKKKFFPRLNHSLSCSALPQAFTSW